jgi:Aerotolerance regulator N-terminal/von Willebrand factor type A domain
MNFLHPWAIAVGVAAIAAPLAVHWLTKPRPRRMPLSTVRFVLAAVQQKRSRFRIRDWIILLLRGLAVMLLAWAFARPLLGAKPLIDTTSDGSAVRIVLLDSSLSMSAISGGQQAFDRARAAAVRYIQYQPDLRTDLLLAAARPGPVFDAASTNFSALREALDAAVVQPQALDVQTAINRAAEIFAKTPRNPGGRVELIILSDFQRSSWASADFSPLPKDALIQLDSVAPAQAPDNLAILRVGAAGRIESGRAIPLEADIGNFSATPREVQVDLSAGDATCRLSGLCSPGVKTTLTGSIVPTMSGWLSGTARLVDVHDSLAADDQRSFVLDVRPPPIYALITREPARPRADSSHFMELALVPMKQSGERVVRIDPAQPDRQALATASLLVLDHPGKLSNDMVNLLTAMLRRGRGMIYIAAEPIDAENLKSLADAAGDDLKMPVEFAPPPANQPRNNLFLLEWKKDQPPFSQMGETMSAAAGSLRFSGGLASRRLEGGLTDDVLATYSDRSAALVVTSCGAGMLAVLNADLPQSNLPSSPVLVPMIGELCGRLLSTNRSTDALRCGEPMAETLPTEISSPQGLSIVGPDGKNQDSVHLSLEGGTVLWRAEEAGPPGIYRVQSAGQTVFAVAAAAPASESDLQTLDPSTLQTKLAAGHAVYFQSAGDQPPRDQIWTWILAGCAVCMILELGVLKAFGT